MLASRPHFSTIVFMERKRIEGLLLDLDGTLIDSNDAHARAWLDALSEQEIRTSYDSVRKLIGMGGDQLLPRIANIDKESAQGQHIDQRRSEIFLDRYLPGIKAFPGSKELLQELKQKGLKLMIATSASEDDLKALLRQTELEDAIECRTSSSDADRSKPNPDILLAALEKLKLEPKDVLMMGDTPYDVEAAKRAGIRSIAFTCGGWSREGLSEADFIFEGPANLLRELHKESSPLNL